MHRNKASIDYQTMFAKNADSCFNFKYRYAKTLTLADTALAPMPS